MKNIIRLTNEYILSTGINKLPIRFKDLEGLLKKEDYELKSYIQAKDLIQNYNLQKHTKYDAFTVHNSKQNLKIVLYSDKISIGSKLIAIAHELGHIVLNHANCGVCEKNFKDDVLEKEADVFALHLLAPLCVLKSRNIKTPEEVQQETLLSNDVASTIYKEIKSQENKEPLEDDILKQFHIRKTKRIIIPAIIVSILVLGLSAFLIIHNITNKPEKSPVIQNPTVENNYISTEPISEIDPQQQEQPKNDKTVYTTKTGRKYHNSDCPYIAGREKFEIKISEAMERDYVPCDFCKPDKD